MMQENPLVAPPAESQRGHLAPPSQHVQPSSPVTRIVLLVLLASFVGGMYWIFHSRKKAAVAAAAAASSAAANRTIPVLTAEVVQKDVPVILEGLGSVTAFYTVTVKTQVDGRIDKVLFTEGQSVKKGDVLIQIDPRPFAIQLETAQAKLVQDVANEKNAKLNADRYKTLSEQNLIATQQYTDQKAMVDQLDAQMRGDQAAIDAARLNLDYARITSPIDGVTGLRLVDPGNVVHATDTNGLVVVTQLDPIAVYFTLPEDDLTPINEAMASGNLKVEARSRDGDKHLAEGKLTVIDNEINQATATLKLKAVFDNPKHVLWPNQFVKARLQLTTRKNAIVIPAAVVQHGPNGTFAYVVKEDNTVLNVPVTITAIQGDIAVVATGLTPGQQVVVDGQAQLKPGSKVVTKPAPVPGAPSAGTAAASPGSAAPTSSGSRHQR
ncbi:MAG TPA: efflux RND transporter periplasmic adaptor subunit [Polyangiaceae bacterium]|jgi:multidrug efflux system membrane fusion protein